MEELLKYSLFTIAGQEFLVGQLILAVGFIFALYLAYRKILKTFFPKVFQTTVLEEEDRIKLFRLFRVLAILLLVLFLILILNLDRVVISREDFNLRILDFVKAGIFFQLARLTDWLVSNIFIHNYFLRRENIEGSSAGKVEHDESTAKGIVKNIFYVVVLIYIIQNFHWDLTLFERNIDGQIVTFGISNILSAILVLLLARLIIWVITQLFLHNVYNSRDIAVGSRYAVNQLVKYVIYVFAIIISLDVFGINMNILLGGAAALLVGVGLGLQQTFNDFVSGIVLLFERSVSVGDVLEVDGEIGRVKQIGLRASTLETRGNIRLVVPNHKLVNEKVTNWNHYNETVRFNIDLGVAYGTDTTLVKKLLLKSVKENPYVMEYPAPFVRFQNFGSSSLDFSLYFFSKNLMVIEDIKSDIRLKIDELFRENDISIPFPQRVVKIVGEK